MDSTSIVSVSKTGNNSKWPIFPQLRNILLLLYIFTFSHFFLYILQQLINFISYCLLINPTRQWFQQCAACVWRHMSSLSLFGRTEPSHVGSRLRAPTCRVAVCLLFGQYERTHMRCDVNWYEYTCCKKKQKNRHPFPSPIPLILHKTNHFFYMCIDRCAAFALCINVTVCV